MKVEHSPLYKGMPGHLRDLRKSARKDKREQERREFKERNLIKTHDTPKK